jgi:hypothetical protein
MNTDKYILEQILEKPERIFRYIIGKKKTTQANFIVMEKQLITNENQFDSILKLTKK